MNARGFSTMHSFNRNRSLTGSNPRPLYYVIAQVRPRRPGVLALHEKLRRRPRSAASAARQATPRSHRQVRTAANQSPTNTQIPKLLKEGCKTQVIKSNETKTHMPNTKVLKHNCKIYNKTFFCFKNLIAKYKSHRDSSSKYRLVL